ncbi:hypothetical protein AYO47_01765 [Planctomyces sp. SCGC AG-212-M04]|jgi:hypothetical protein|nr:hypothetical protein AYO47_01765 [Planctomyces sp. SCGC AG-212-M04]
MTIEEVNQLIDAVCDHYALKGSLLAQIEFVASTVEQAREHKDRVIATGNKEQMDAAGQQFTVLSQIVEKLPKQLDEIERQIARGREAVSQALQVLATQS